jgi:hypothetical protein
MLAFTKFFFSKMAPFGKSIFVSISDPSWSEISISDYNRNSNQPLIGKQIRAI